MKSIALEGFLSFHHIGQSLSIDFQFITLYKNTSLN